MSNDRIIYIVDDDEAVRSALSLLMRAEGFKAQCFASADAFLAAFQPESASCLLVDVRMPGMSGLELQQQLAQRQIPLPVIIMTGHGDVAMAVAAMKAGAMDFIEKPFRNQDLLDRIQQCIEKYDQQLLDKQQRTKAMELLALLTEREREVMDLLVTGKLNKQIAAELDISVRTAEAHRARIMEKLQVRTLADVVRISLLVV